MTGKRKVTPRGAMAAAVAPAPAPAVASAPAASPAPVAPARDAAPDVRPYKFTMLMDDDLQEVADRAARKARRLVGSHVSRADLVRVLLVLAADDQTLIAQVADELRAKKRGD